MSRVFAYCRVSTADQHTDNQVMEIVQRGHNIDPKRVISETVSGSVPAMERKGFARLVDRLEGGDVLVITKLDRLGRNAMDVRATVEMLAAQGVQVQILKAGNTGEIELAFETAAKERMGAVIVSSDPVFLTQRDQIVALATRTAMPNIHAFREYALAGGLMSYGPQLTDAYRLTGIYAGRILNGEKPGDLPVQQAVKVELVVNLKTAKALGLTVPPSILARADEVLE